MHWYNFTLLPFVIALASCSAALHMDSQTQTAVQVKTTAQCDAKPVLVEAFENANSSVAKTLTRDPNYRMSENSENNYLISTYVSNEEGSERNTRHVDLPPMQSATLNFDIWFEPDFDFILGGKLPGFAPDNPSWGGEDVGPDNWSNRIMWREGGEPIAYIYHQDRPHKWGHDSNPVGPTSYMPIGEWITLSLYTNLGTGEKDGFTEVWMSGKKVSERRDINFQAKGAIAPITTLAFHTFFGGNTPKWAPRDKAGNYKNLTARFDNIAVYEGLCVRA